MSTLIVAQLAQELPMRELPVFGGYTSQVDDDVFEWARQHTWYANVQPKAVGTTKIYVFRRTYRKSERLHRLILAAPEHMQVDHIDGDTLNNQRSNLRLCSCKENATNVRVIRASSGFKGVTYRPFKNRNGRLVPQKLPYRARLLHNRQNYELGHFLTGEEAAAAYDRKAKEFFGEFAATNAELLAGNGGPA